VSATEEERDEVEEGNSGEGHRNVAEPAPDQPEGDRGGRPTAHQAATHPGPEGRWYDVAIEHVPIVHQPGRGPRISALGAGVGLQLGIAQRRMTLDLRSDRPDLDWDLPVPRETLAPVDQRQERIAVGLHRLRALGPVGKDQDVGRRQHAVGTRVILRRGLNETVSLSGDSGIRESNSTRRPYFWFATQGGGRWLGIESILRKTSDESSMRNARAIPISWFATRC